jgi:predicted permease
MVGMALLLVLLPLLLVIALGAFLEWRRFFGPGFIAGANRLTYWVALPVVVLHSLATADHAETDVQGLLVVLIGATLAGVALAWLMARAIGVEGASVGTWVQAAFRGNLTFVGLPLLLTLPDVPRTAAILALGPLLVAFNGLSVVLLLASRERSDQPGWRLALRELARNPIILASVLGGSLYLLEVPIWVPLERTLGQVGRMAVPLALLSIGSALVATPLRGNVRPAVLAACFKSVVSPLIGLGLARLVQLDPGATRVVLLLLACPTAGISYTMVRELGGDQAIAAASIVISAGLSAVSLAVILTWA